MSQQRPYEGFSYPTEFQGGGGDAYFSTNRTAPAAPSSSSGGAAAGVSNTGLTRRSNQHTANTTTTTALAPASANNNASPTGPGPVAVAFNAASRATNAYDGGYGYFHSHGNSIDVNSGYNSDVGSSVSNPRMPNHSNTSGSNPGSGYPMTGAVGGASRVPEAVTSQGGLNVSANATDVSPVRPPQPPRFAAAQRGSAVPGVTSLSGDGGGGVFQTGGASDSAANSTRSSSSARPPVGPPAFLPSRPFVQTPPLTSSSPYPGQQPPQPQHHPHPQQPPYVVPMPSSMHNGNDPLGGAPQADFGGAGPRLPHTVSPSTSGPRMPATSGEYAHSAHAHGNAGGGGAGGSGGGGRGGLFSRLVAQVLPTFDDGAAVAAGGGGSALGGDANSVPRERPPHQLRFGNPADDLPLLEELGIFPRHILDKARAVLNPFKTMSVDSAKDTDLAGPILFALSLALLLSLRGKIQFSAIYGLFVLGVTFFKVLLSLMQSKSGGAPLQFVVSTVGYGLLPTVLLAVVRTTCSWLLTRRALLPLTLLMIVWSAWCGSVLVAKGLGMEEQRYLVLYPMLLFYAAFDALTVF